MIASKKTPNASSSFGGTETDSKAAARTSDINEQKRIADVIGIFADEPLWDEVMVEVKALRERQNAPIDAGATTE